MTFEGKNGQIFPAIPFLDDESTVGRSEHMRADSTLSVQKIISERIPVADRSVGLLVCSSTNLLLGFLTGSGGSYLKRTMQETREDYG